MKKEILQINRIEEYRKGNQLEAKGAQGGMSDTLWDSYSASANTDGGCILNYFFLINYGERAGSGLNSIFHVWNHVYHTPAEIREDLGVDRVFVSLSNGGHEQDVKAMLELYDHPEELTFPNMEMSDKMSDKYALKDKIKAELTDKNKIHSN